MYRDECNSEYDRYEDDHCNCSCCNCFLCISRCFHFCYNKCISREGVGGVALNAVDSVRLLYIKKIDDEFEGLAKFGYQNITKRSKLLARIGFMKHGERKQRLKMILALEKGLKCYEKGHKHIMASTALPERLLKKHERKLESLTSNYRDEEIECYCNDTENEEHEMNNIKFLL